MFTTSIHCVGCVEAGVVEKFADQPGYRRYFRTLEITDIDGEVLSIMMFADEPGALVIRGAETPTKAELNDMAAQHEPETVNGEVVGGGG